MNIRDLQKPVVKENFVVVRGRALEHHVMAARANNISDDRVIEEAFREVYEQLDRQKLVSAIDGLSSTHKEVLPKVLRGDIVARGKNPELVIDFLKNHPEGKTMKEVCEGTGILPQSVNSAVEPLLKHGLVERSVLRPYKYFLINDKREVVVEEFDELESMIPKGTKVSAGLL